MYARKDGNTGLMDEQEGKSSGEEVELKAAEGVAAKSQAESEGWMGNLELNQGNASRDCSKEARKRAPVLEQDKEALVMEGVSWGRREDRKEGAECKCMHERTHILS